MKLYSLDDKFFMKEISDIGVLTWFGTHSSCSDYDLISKIALFSALYTLAKTTIYGNVPSDFCNEWQKDRDKVMDFFAGFFANLEIMKKQSSFDDEFLTSVFRTLTDYFADRGKDYKQIYINQISEIQKKCFHDKPVLKVYVDDVLARSEVYERYVEKTFKHYEDMGIKIVSGGVEIKDADLILTFEGNSNSQKPKHFTNVLAFSKDEEMACRQGMLFPFIFAWILVNGMTEKGVFVDFSKYTLSAWGNMREGAFMISAELCNSIEQKLVDFLKSELISIAA